MSAVAAEPKIVLGRKSNGMLMTPAEFDAVEEYDENYRYELINGVLIVSPIPLGEETGPNELLGVWLYLYGQQPRRRKIIDFTLPQQYVRTQKSRRIADRLIWTGLGRIPDPEKDLPTIAVEFVSAGSRNRKRDYVEKKKEYLEIDIAEYWIVDRFQRTLTVVRKGPPGIVEQVITENMTYRTPLLPGFKLPLAELLAAADRIAAARGKRRAQRNSNR
jgi:Uma2 family endonuclease